jgi:hypothetical protein
MSLQLAQLQFLLNFQLWWPLLLRDRQPAPAPEAAPAAPLD